MRVSVERARLDAVVRMRRAAYVGRRWPSYELWHLDWVALCWVFLYRRDQLNVRIVWLFNGVLCNNCLSREHNISDIL